MILLTLQIVPATAAINFETLYLDCGSSLYAFEKNLTTDMGSAARPERSFVYSYSHMFLDSPRIVQYENPGKKQAEITSSVISLGYRDRIDRATGFLYDFQDTQFENARQCSEVKKSALLRRIDEHNARLRNNGDEF